MKNIIFFLRRFQSVFIYSGVIITAIVADFTIFHVLHSTYAIGVTQATTISIAISVLLLLHLIDRYNYWTGHELHIPVYNIVFILSLLVSVSFMEGFTNMGMNADLAKALSIIPVLTVQYALNLSIAYKYRRFQHSPSYVQNQPEKLPAADKQNKVVEEKRVVTQGVQ